MIVEPNHKQHPDIRKLNLTVAKLKEVTNEAMSPFFADKTTPNNAKKKPYLQEILRVAREEEKYKNGKIGSPHAFLVFPLTSEKSSIELTQPHADADTLVYDMADDKIPDDYQSDDDSYTTRDDDDGGTRSGRGGVAIASGLSSLSPQKNAPPPGLMPSLNSPASALHGTLYMGNMPVRSAAHFQPSIIPSDMGAGQHDGYVDGGSLSTGGQGSMHPHGGRLSIQDFATAGPSQDASRRSSMFSGSPADYGPPADYVPASAAGAGMYPTGGCQQQGATAPPGTNAMYAFTPPHQQQQAQQLPQRQPQGAASFGSESLGAGQQYLEPPFDGIPRGPYHQTQHGSLFRSAHVGQDSVAEHNQEFSGYVPHDGRGLPEMNLKDDPLGRGLLH